MKRLLILYSVFCLLCSVSYGANDFSGDPNCVALWRFEDGALTTDSKSTNTLTDGGGVSANTTNYKEGYASLDATSGTNDYLYRADADLSSGFPGKNGESNSSFSVCFWMQIRTYPATGTHNYLVTKYTDAGNKRSYAVTYVNLATGNDGICLLFGNVGGTAGATFNQGAHIPWPTSEWLHVGVTYDNSDRSYRIRAWNSGTSDFLAADKTGTTANDLNIEDAPFVIGDRGDMNDTYGIEAWIDEVVIFNDVLSTDEIDAIRSFTYSSAPVAGGQVIMVEEF